MTDLSAGTGEDAGGLRRAEFRYGAVFLLMMALLVLVIVAPAGNATRAAVFALEGGALLVVVATSRERRAVRNARVRVLGAIAPLLVAGVAFGAVSALRRCSPPTAS